MKKTIIVLALFVGVVTNAYSHFKIGVEEKYVISFLKANPGIYAFESKITKNNENFVTVKKLYSDGMLGDLIHYVFKNGKCIQITTFFLETSMREVVERYLTNKKVDDTEYLSAWIEGDAFIFVMKEYFFDGAYRCMVQKKITNEIKLKYKIN